MAVEEIEKELKRLLHNDLEAQSVRWEIVEEDGTEEPEDEDQDDGTEGYDGDSDLEKDDDKDLELSDDDDI